MAKQSTKTAATPAPVKEETALAKTGTMAMAQAERPSFIKHGDRTGTEDIGPDDLRLPRLAFAQGLSPQLVPEDSNYIDGLKMFDMFNDLSNEVYGRGPLSFIPIRRDVRRIQFRPREEGGGVLDLNVPANDPRCSWTTDPTSGERRPPLATKFVEFVVLLLHDDGREPEPIVLSIKDTNKFNRRASERLTGFIKLRQAPIYAGVYTVASKTEKNDQGTFAVPVITNAGFVQDEPLYRLAEEFAASIATKTIHVQREPGDEPFDDANGGDRPDM